MPKTASLTLVSPGLFRHPQKVWKQKCCRAPLCCQVDRLSAPRLLHLASCTCAFAPFSSPPFPLPAFLPRQAHSSCMDPIPASRLEGLGVLFWIFLFGSEPKSRSAFLRVSSTAVGRRAQLVWSDLALVIICYFSTKITPFQLWINK